MTLLWLSIAFIIGVLAGGEFALSWPVALLPGVVLLLLSLKAPPGIRLWLLMTAAILLGVARGSPSAVPRSPGTIQFYAGRDVSVDGVVDVEPDIRDRSILYVVSVRTVTWHAESRQVGGKIEVRLPRSQEFDYGDGVHLTGRLLLPRNTTTLPWKDILARRGIGVEMQYPAALDTGPTPAGLLGWIVPLRLHLEQGINAWLPEPEAALLIAITLGAKSASLGDLAPALVTTGLIHIIAISGIKVAMVAGTLYAFFRPLRLRLMTLVVTVLGLILYVILTGATASGERSGLMWCMVFVAAYLGRGTVALVSLGFVAACMVAFDPSLLSDIGFQLSTIGTFTIVALGSPLDRLFRYIPAPWREALSTTVAAQIGTLPIVVSGFHVVAFAGPLANALVLPLLPILIGLGFLLGALSAVTGLAAPLGALSYAVLHLIVTIASMIGILGSGAASSISPALSMTYYVCLATVAFLLLRHSNWAPVGVYRGHGRDISLALLAGTALAVPGVGAPSTRTAGLTWLGTGNAMLLTSGDREVLFDGGPKPFVLLERLGRLLPAYQHTIDLIVVTDPRASNVTSLIDVLSHYRVLSVLDVGSEYPSMAYARWRTALDSRHIPTYALRTGVEVRLDGMTIVSVGPDAVYSDPRDSAGLLRVEWQHHNAVLVGSASLREQVESVFRPVNLRAQVLVAGGSIESRFIGAVRPAITYSTAVLPIGTRSRRLGSLPVTINLSP